MNQGWHKKRLGEVCALIKRGVAPRYLEDGGLCVINQKCIRDHQIDYSKARRHDLEKKKVNPERLIMAGDVLVNSTGTGTLGRVAQVRREPEEPATVDTHVTIVRPTPGLFHDDYFGYMLIHIEDEIKASGEGACGQTELARTKLENDFVVIYPDSHEEQQRIVTILDEAFAGIAAATANAEQNLKNARELFENYLSAALCRHNSCSFETKIGDVCKLYQGLAINKKTKHLLVEKSSLPLLRIKDLRDGTEEQYVAEDGYPKNALVQKEDIVYTRTGNSLGLVFRGREGVLHNNSFKVIPDAVLDHGFIFWWLQEPLFKSTIFKLASKAAQPDITHAIFKEQRIFVPPVDIQKNTVKEIESVYRDVLRLEVIYQQKLDALAELKQSLLQKAFAGELH